MVKIRFIENATNPHPFYFSAPLLVANVKLVSSAALGPANLPPAASGVVARLAPPPRSPPEKADAPKIPTAAWLRGEPLATRKMEQQRAFAASMVMCTVVRPPTTAAASTAAALAIASLSVAPALAALIRTSTTWSGTLGKKCNP